MFPDNHDTWKSCYTGIKPLLPNAFREFVLVQEVILDFIRTDLKVSKPDAWNHMFSGLLYGVERFDKDAELERRFTRLSTAKLRQIDAMKRTAPVRIPPISSCLRGGGS